MVVLGDVGGSASGLCVRRGGSTEVPAKLMKVTAYRMPPVTVAEHLAKPLGLSQPSGGAQDMADGNRPPQDRGRILTHRVIGQSDQIVVPREDLQPVGLFGAGCVVVQCRDGGLYLIAARTANGQRRLQHALALRDFARVPQAAVLLVQCDDAAL